MKIAMVPIEVSDLSKEFAGDILAVDNLNLSIEEGEIFGSVEILGELHI